MYICKKLVMISLSEKKFIHKHFYNVERIPDIGVYVKKVMASCKTFQQLWIAYRWGLKAIREKCNKIEVELTCRGALEVCDRKVEVIKDVQTAFDKYAEKL